MDYVLDISEVLDFVDDLQKVGDVVARENKRFMRQSLDTLEGLVAGNTPVGATSALQSATTSEMWGTPSGLNGRVFNPLKYDAPVEYGRKPGKMPPVSDIKLWVVRKLGLTGKEADTAAFLIARAIGRRGTKGAFMFKKAYDQGRSVILRNADDLPDRIVMSL